jgi:hypothetical protein
MTAIDCVEYSMTAKSSPQMILRVPIVAPIAKPLPPFRLVTAIVEDVKGEQSAAKEANPISTTANAYVLIM